MTGEKEASAEMPTRDDIARIVFDCRIFSDVGHTCADRILALFAPILAEKELEKAALAEEINRLRSDLDEAYKVLEPFDDALGEDDDGYPDDTKLTLSWRAHTDYSLTLGDLRRARAAAIRAQANNEPGA